MKRVEDMTDRDVALWAQDEILRLKRLADRQREEIHRLRKLAYGYDAPQDLLRRCCSGGKPLLTSIEGGRS